MRPAGWPHTESCARSAAQRDGARGGDEVSGERRHQNVRRRARVHRQPQDKPARHRDAERKEESQGREQKLPQLKGQRHRNLVNLNKLCNVTHSPQT